MKNSFGDNACYMKMKNLLHLSLILFFPLTEPLCTGLQRSAGNRGNKSAL